MNLLVKGVFCKEPLRAQRVRRFKTDALFYFIQETTRQQK